VRGIRTQRAGSRDLHNVVPQTHGLWLTALAANGSDVEQTYSEQSAFLVVYGTIATPNWVYRCVESQLLLSQTLAARERPFSDDFWDRVLRRGEEGGFAASRYVAHALRMLVSSDVASRHTTPLSIVRRAVTYPTQVLQEAGILPVRQSLLTTRVAHVEDPYGLAPTTLAALHPLLPEVTRRWEVARTAMLWERSRRDV
jgi:hypothetical protein